MKLILKAIINGLKAFTDTTSQDPRMSDPDFDPLREMRTGNGSSPPSPEKSESAFEKIKELIVSGEWRSNLYKRTHESGLSFLSYPSYLELNGKPVQFLTYSQKEELDKLWEMREMRESIAQRKRIAASQLSQFLGT